MALVFLTWHTWPNDLKDYKILYSILYVSIYLFIDIFIYIYSFILLYLYRIYNSLFPLKTATVQISQEDWLITNFIPHIHSQYGEWKVLNRSVFLTDFNCGCFSREFVLIWKQKWFTNNLFDITKGVQASKATLHRLFFLCYVVPGQEY